MKMKVACRRASFFCEKCLTIMFMVLLCLSLDAALPPVVLDPTSCPAQFGDFPLILISMDGFRADYIDRGYTPTLAALANLGVKAPFIKPSYPAITFPNHYTIVTGLLPPYHGIVANRFYDPDFNATFRVGRAESFQKRFWGGEPIWQTAERQGKIAATYFWPGSEVVGQQATYWLPYNGTHLFEARVDKVLSWLDLPSNERPSFITLYMQEPDRQGHIFGPDSVHLNEALKKVDGIIKYLLDGLQERNLTSCVNLLILADHGMAEAGKERLIDLRKYISDIDLTTRFWNGVFPRFEPLDGSEGESDKMMEELACKSPQFRVYRKTHLPVRWHLGAQKRIEEVVIDLDPGMQIDFDGTYKPDQGDHGYDNIFHVMNALFLAHGPSFRRGVEVESFQNIEIYNLMCALLRINPAPNNGTWGSLHHLLNDPPPLIPEPPQMELPAIALLPRKHSILEERLTESLCFSDDVDLEKWLPLLWNAEEGCQQLMETHVPWGITHSIKLTSSALKLLYHYDHVTAFSEKLKMPFWTSFYLHKAEGSKISNWTDDVRISKEDLNEPCVEHFEDDELWEPLFHPEFSLKKWMRQFPFLTSNAVPLTKFLRKKWRKLRNLIHHWSNEYSEVNVVMGTAFDYNENTLMDDLSQLSEDEDIIYAPTHLFAVITRCLGGKDLSCCSPNMLDVIAFIFPQSLSVENCMVFEDFAREFLAKVDDVEKLTGLRFYPNLTSLDRIRLKTRFHSNLWNFETWENRLQSDIFGLKKKR